MSAYDKLMAFQRQTEALAQVAGRLGWDQETMMPRGAAEQRYSLRLNNGLLPPPQQLAAAQTGCGG